MGKGTDMRLLTADPTATTFCSAFDVTHDRCTVVEVFDTREEAEAACAGQNEIKVFEIVAGDNGEPLATVQPGVRAFIGAADGLDAGKVWA